MGVYLNPGNMAFAGIRNGEYIDKTGLISLINDSIDTPGRLTCVSRPRRFGKSFAAQMLCAYYDKTCDSSALFASLEISGTKDYKKYLNKYDVIYLDMANLMGKTHKEKLVDFIQKAILEELKEEYSGISSEKTLDENLIHTVEQTGNRFIMIVDEWDAPVREAPQIQREYLLFLRMLFKSSGTTARIFAAAYMTGILPIKKDASQSAISDFREFTILNPGPFARYTGFTEGEVRALCQKNHMSFESARKWYDGYAVNDLRSVYNPYSVMCAVQYRRFTSYWKRTSAAEALLPYIDMDFEGLQSDIMKLICGESIEVDTGGFDNDLQTFRDKNDVLTLLIHLGYLAYEEEQDSGQEPDGAEEPAGFAHIPNEEVRLEFHRILRRGKNAELIKLVQRSDQLLRDTLEGHEGAVAEGVSQVRDSEYAPDFYNNEQSLRYVIRFAYITCVDQYARIEEMPSGHGIADVVFLPKRRSPLPAMIVELKWNKTAEGAIAQIRERSYPAALNKYGGEIVLVGINYSEKTKKHTCKIERVFPPQI